MDRGQGGLNPRAHTFAPSVHTLLQTLTLYTHGQNPTLQYTLEKEILDRISYATPEEILPNLHAVFATFGQRFDPHHRIPIRAITVAHTAWERWSFDLQQWLGIKFFLEGHQDERVRSLTHRIFKRRRRQYFENHKDEFDIAPDVEPVVAVSIDGSSPRRWRHRRRTGNGSMGSESQNAAGLSGQG